MRAPAELHVELLADGSPGNWSRRPFAGAERYELAGDSTMRRVRIASSIGRIRQALNCISPAARTARELLEHAIAELEKCR
jgi:hypothetical protein